MARHRYRAQDENHVLVVIALGEHVIVSVYGPLTIDAARKADDLLSTQDKLTVFVCPLQESDELPTEQGK